MRSRRWIAGAVLLVSAVTPAVTSAVGPASAAPVAAAADPCDANDPRLDLDGRPVDDRGDPQPACPDIGPTSGAAGGSATVLSVVAGKRVVRVGESVAIPVSVANPQNVAVTNVNVEVGYTGSVVAVDGAIRNGTLFDRTLRQSNANQAGRILFGVARPAGVPGETGTGTLFVVMFKAVGKPGDKSPVPVKVTTMNGPDGQALRPVEVAGEVEILTADGGKAGDCDGDGVLRENDALCALQISVQLFQPTAGQRAALDLDPNGEINSRDAAVILQRATGRA